MLFEVGPFTLMPSQAPCACSAELWMCSHTNPFSVSSKTERSSAPSRRARKERKGQKWNKPELIVQRDLPVMQQAQWNTSKFRHIDGFGQLFAAEKVRSVALNWLSGQCREAVRANAAGVWAELDECKRRASCCSSLTFFTGHASVLLQSDDLQVEGVTVVPERHPGPIPDRVGTLARVDPLVTHRLVWQGETTSGIN